MTNTITKNTITVLGKDYQPLVVEVVEGYPDSDVTYRAEGGHLASASWRLLFIREALDLCEKGWTITGKRTIYEICCMVMMPTGEYDWSFIRDADEQTLFSVSEHLYTRMGKTMKKMGLTSVTKFRR